MPSVEITSETTISEAVLKILVTTASGEGTIAYLRNRIPEYVELSDADRQMSTTRPNEEIWEQRLRNIRSHVKSEGNFINLGYLTAPSRGRLRITEAGRRYAQA